MSRDDEQDERDRRDPPKRPGRSEWMDEEDKQPRRNDDSGEYQKRYPRSKGGLPLWAILLIVFGAIGLVGCVGSVALGMLGWAVARPAAPLPPIVVGADERRTYTREEFTKLVVGKTEAEVIAAVGKPDRTSTLAGTDTAWHYVERTVDPLNGKTDASAQVVFKDGRAHHVNY